jgi:hypothetical protein
MYGGYEKCKVFDGKTLNAWETKEQLGDDIKMDFRKNSIRMMISLSWLRMGSTANFFTF